MKRLIILTASFLLVASLCFAGGFSFSEKRELRDQGYTRSDIRKLERGRDVEPTYKYEGFSGQRYKYDLSDPGDRIDYRLDPGAQLNDRINDFDPDVKMDRRMNQYGGGIMN